MISMYCAGYDRMMVDWLVYNASSQIVEVVGEGI